MRRLALTLLALLVLVGLGADTAAWWWATGRMAVEVAERQAAWRQAGWSVGSGPPYRAGWPFAAELLLPDVVVAGGEPDVPGGLSWRVDLLRLRFDPFDPHQLTVIPEGVQHVRAGAFPAATLAADRFQASIPLDGTGAAILRATALRAAAAGQVLAATHATLRLLPNAIDLDAAGIDLPAALPTPFGTDIAVLALSARLDGPVPPVAAPPRWAAAWRDGGGKLTILQAAIHWGALDAQGAGAVTLDPALQPRGAFTLRVAGYPDAIAALSQSGALRPNDARVAMTLLGLLARTPPGGKPEVTAPLTLEAGTLTVGAFPVARVPPLAWGAAAPGG